MNSESCFGDRCQLTAIKAEVGRVARAWNHLLLRPFVGQKPQHEGTDMAHAIRASLTAAALVGAAAVNANAAPWHRLQRRSTTTARSRRCTRRTTFAAHTYIGGAIAPLWKCTRSACPHTGIGCIATSRLWSRISTTTRTMITDRTRMSAWNRPSSACMPTGPDAPIFMSIAAVAFTWVGDQAGSRLRRVPFLTRHA